MQLVMVVLIYCIACLPDTSALFTLLYLVPTTQLKVEDDRLSLKTLLTFMNSKENTAGDIWELLGRSMLKDFGERRRK
jgi:hypothetical protein